MYLCVSIPVSPTLTVNLSDGDDTDQWIAIAAAVPGRTNKSCRKVRKLKPLNGI